MHYPEHSNPT